MEGSGAGVGRHLTHIPTQCNQRSRDRLNRGHLTGPVSGGLGVQRRKRSRHVACSFGFLPNRVLKMVFSTMRAGGMFPLFPLQNVLVGSSPVA